ncbi:MAG: hypothetical protein CVV44_03795 [Spirochaetae bacterium HGW-Spirochaetae-1]|jgi:hypothetical protein|nr:MAG: hypothetical protein CVV44_03795 [Spirochaetae bacterium HGW-Spirochaetae-1]
MKDIRSYLINYNAATSEYPSGSLKDNPGDNTGSQATVDLFNDILYAIIAFILKYGTLSDTDETVLASDFVDAVEAAFSDLAVLLTGAQTVAGVKTFSSTIVGSIDSIKETGSAGATLRKKDIEIGDWDMDATEIVNVTHGLTRSKIRNVHVHIRSDSDSSSGYDDTCLERGGYYMVSDTYVTLRRTASGAFDRADYNATSYNRGWVTIEYID